MEPLKGQLYVMDCFSASSRNIEQPVATIKGDNSGFLEGVARKLKGTRKGPVS